MFIFTFQNVNAQATVNQTFIDKCTGEVKIATTTYVNGNAVISFYNQIKMFTAFEVTSGIAQSWLLSVKTSYESITCPLNNPVVTQTVQQTVTQATATAVTTAASTTASSATSSSSSTTSSESKSEDSKSESNEESDSNEESESEEEENKKQQNINPMLLASDLTSAQSIDGSYSVMISIGVSRSSMSGDKSYGVNGIVWSTLNQFALSSNYTKMDFSGGKLNAIHSYGLSLAYLNGTWMTLPTYTYIKPNPILGTYGMNVGGIGLLTKNNNNNSSINILTSIVWFWTKPFEYSKKLLLSPQIFIMSSPISYDLSSKTTNIDRHFGFLLGSSFDYKISKRFGFSFNYKSNINTSPGSRILHNFLIGSRMIL
jgi:hypothetical protein